MSSSSPKEKTRTIPKWVERVLGDTPEKRLPRLAGYDGYSWIRWAQVRFFLIALVIMVGGTTLLAHLLTSYAEEFRPFHFVLTWAAFWLTSSVAVLWGLCVVVVKIHVIPVCLARHWIQRRWREFSKYPLRCGAMDTLDLHRDLALLAWAVHRCTPFEGPDTVRPAKARFWAACELASIYGHHPQTIAWYVRNWSPDGVLHGGHQAAG